MIPFLLSNIAPVLNAKRVGADCTISSITTDSRSIDIRNGCLFIALKGNRFDAHNFASNAVTAGCTALLVNHYLSLDIPQLIVTDTRHALGLLGFWIRQQVKTRIVALTGSSGKTSVKKMTDAILCQCGQVLVSKENFNNDIGVPLTLLLLTPDHDFAVIEIGTSHLGEIAKITNLVQPETALINNLSLSHLDGLGSLSGIAQAKGEIFDSLPIHGCGIFNADSHDWLHWQHKLRNKKVWRFAVNSALDVDFYATNIVSNQQGIDFILHSPIGICPVHLYLQGEHNVANALAASALALSVGASLSAITDGLAQIHAVPGRLFPISFGIGKLLLDDSYNANIGSITVAIKVLSDMPGYRIMIVGDIAELGKETVKYHCQIGKIIAQAGINKVLSIGELSYFISKTSGCGEHFQDNTLLNSRLVQLLSEHTIVTALVKGSRNAAMDRIVHALQVHRRIQC